MNRPRRQRSEPPKRLAEAGRGLDDLENHAQLSLRVQVGEPPASVDAKPLAAREHVDAILLCGGNNCADGLHDRADVMDAFAVVVESLLMDAATAERLQDLDLWLVSLSATSVLPVAGDPHQLLSILDGCRSVPQSDSVGQADPKGGEKGCEGSGVVSGISLQWRRRRPDACSPAG
jgi:hypothetical protein